MIVVVGFLFNRDAIKGHRTLFFAGGSAAELMCCGAFTTEGVNYTQNCFKDI